MIEVFVHLCYIAEKCGQHREDRANIEEQTEDNSYQLNGSVPQDTQGGLSLRRPQSSPTEPPQAYSIAKFTQLLECYRYSGRSGLLIHVKKDTQDDFLNPALFHRQEMQFSLVKSLSCILKWPRSSHWFGDGNMIGPDL